MTSLVGFLIVLGAVLGGFAMAGGPFPVLIQPAELVIIGGAALGSLFVASPGKVRSRVLTALKRGFRSDSPTEKDYVDLLKLLFELFGVMRREGILALENHVPEYEKSTIFSKYPSVTSRHHAMEFLIDGLKQLVDGCPVEDLAQLFDAELETHHEEAAQPVGLIRTVGDALPGLGIVAAVLGIVITMAHLDGGPEEIGHHVAAALVGTFLGILLCYGFVSPLATNVEMSFASEARYMACMKDAVLAAARGMNPAISIEFGRRAIFSDERPSSVELEKAFAELRR